MIPKGYKHTDIGIIPNEWEVYSIQNLLDNKTIKSHLDGNHGALYPRSEEFVSYGVPYVGANDFIDSQVNFNNCKFLPLERAKQFRKGVALNGDVLFAHNATVGPVAFLETNLEYIILSTTATYFRCENSKLLNKYLLYYLQSKSFVEQYTSVMSQSTRFQVPITTQRKFHIILPPLPEQQAIAQALSDTDALITNLQNLIAKKRLIKQGAMQELLKPKKGWEESTLKEVANFRRGSFPQPYGLDKWYDDTNGYPFVQVFDVDDNFKLKPETKRRISAEAQKMSVFIKKGSLIITIQGSIGRIAITQYDAYVDRTLLFFESFKVNFDTYFFMLLVHLIFEKEKENAPGGIIRTITKEALSSFKISYPKTLEEQTQIATILTDMDNEINTLTQKLEKYKSIKQGMMQDLLTGKVRLV